MNDDDGPARSPRELRASMSPGHYATVLLQALEAHFEHWLPDMDFSVYMQQLWEDQPEPADGDLFLAEIAAFRADPESVDGKMAKGVSREQLALFAGTAYAVQAVKEYQAGNQNLAWGYAVSAAQWEGYLSGLAGELPADTSSETFAVWRKLLSEHIVEIDASSGSRGKALAEHAGRWLAKADPEHILFDESTRELSYKLAAGGWTKVKKKSIQTALSVARKACPTEP